MNGEPSDDPGSDEFPALTQRHLASARAIVSSGDLTRSIRERIHCSSFLTDGISSGRVEFGYWTCPDDARDRSPGPALSWTGSGWADRTSVRRYSR